jgi:hypothetical protein
MGTLAESCPFTGMLPSRAAQAAAGIQNPYGPITATGATAGTPGTFSPAGANAPYRLADLTGVTASPATVWTTGQRVVLSDGTEAHWTGSAWAAGRKP